MNTSKSLVAVAITTLLALSACGGGGGSTGSGSGSGTTPSPPPTSTGPVVQAPPVVIPATPTVNVTVDSVSGPRTFTVPLATQIGTTLDTLPSAITGEASLALWPMVAGVNAHKDFAGKLTADQFPAGIWPIYFKYTSKTSSDRSDPTSGTSSSNFACSLNLVAGALVATVDGRTFSAPLDDLPTYTADSFGNPLTGDGYRVFVAPTQTASYVLATKRSVMMLAEANNTYVDPMYGPKNAGPSMTLRASYEGFVAGIPAGSTTLFINSTDTQTGVFTQYRCKDQLI